ncbi:MAG: hypothetical protein VX899_16465 [Myxococcota bacterium]|nr:hypothetical protein [Myxococcota bacterium]
MSVGSTLSALGNAGRAFGEWNKRVGRAAFSPAACTAAAMGLNHHSAQLAMLSKTASQGLADEAETIKRLEVSVQEALEGHRSGKLDFHSPYTAGPVRDLARKGVPFKVRRLAMDWLSRPYDVACPDLAPLHIELEALAVDAARTQETASRLFTAAVGGETVELEPLNVCRAELSELSESALEFVEAHHKDVLAASWRREWLEYLEYRLLPATTDPKPRPVPREPPDAIRRLSRKHVPENLRHALRDWAIP